MYRPGRDVAAGRSINPSKTPGIGTVSQLTGDIYVPRMGHVCPILDWWGRNIASFSKGGGSLIVDQPHLCVLEFAIRAWKVMDLR